MAPIERLSSVIRPAYFITTAYGKAGKADLAMKAGYTLLPSHLQFIAEEASRREDLFAEALRLKVVDHHYKKNSDIPNTVNAAANKAEGVDWSFEELKRTHPGEALDLAGRDYEVMDNQMVVVDTMGHKVGLKKPRHDTSQHLQEDILRLLDLMKRGSEDGSHIEYLSTFIRGVFGKQTIKEYKTVRTVVGTILKDINLGLMGQFMTNNLHITGAIDIEELIGHFVEHTGAHVRIRKYNEGRRHYEGNVVIIDQLVQVKENTYYLPGDYIINNNVLPALARGFL
ncbi:MAG: hypothetical protein WA061_04525 [Microgenomates group bacterium]